MTVYQRLVQIAIPYRGTLIAGLFLVLLATGIDTGLVPILFLAFVFLVIGAESFEEHGYSLEFFDRDWGQEILRLTGHISGSQLLLLLATAMIVIYFVKCVLEGRHGFLLNKFATLMARDIRQRLFVQFTRFTPAHLEYDTTGSLLSRITGDVMVLQQHLGPQLVPIVRAPITILLALCLLFSLSWRLTLIALVLAPVITAIIGIAGRRIRKLTSAIQDRLADLNAFLVERLSNLRIIQSFTREPYEISRVQHLNQQYYRETLRSVQVTETLTPGIEFLAMVGMVIGIIVGALSVFRGLLEPEEFMLFVFWAQRIGAEFKQLSRMNQFRQQINGAGERVFKILDIEPSIQDAPHAEPLPPVEGQIVFDHVSFSYSGDEKVLDDINLKVAPGEVIALVGPSGAGKTTLVNLLPRFYDPTSGRILIDGKDLRDITLESLRSQVGIVPQETVLFSGTIHENILYGNLHASEEEVVEAARAANALQFIERLPQGFQTVVGERGARLSGGQRQRVAIARALLKNPRVLVLDEATSALDSESEMLVQQALERLMENRTTFVIAHRLSTIQHATRILVMDQGRIMEVGTHAELLELGGLYQRLHELQFRGARAPEPAMHPEQAGL